MTPRRLLSDQAGNGSRYGLSDLFNLLFGVDWLAARLRRWLVFSGFFLAWMIVAFSLHPWQEYSNLPVKIWVVLKTLSAPDTLLFLIVLLVPFFMAREWAATYLADIFEFDNNRVTRPYLDHAAFGVSRGPDDVVHIRDHNVHTEYADSTLIKIGGPGRVVVHLESVAVFEKADGTPRVVGPHNAKQRIDGFERLRAVIDLRDHTETFDVEARTRDGILLRAKNVRVLFSVARGDAWNPQTWDREENLPRRWEYDPDAILSLVYNQKKRPWHRQMVDGKAKPALRNFIARHTFQELVSNILPTEDADAVQFVFREEILDVFRDEFRSQLQASGIQLNWIGVGTWETAAQSLNERHLQLWKESLTKRKQAREGSLRKLRFNTCMDTLLHLTQRTLVAGSLVPDGATKEVRMRRILFELRQRIRQALMWMRRLERQGDEARECPGLVGAEAEEPQLSERNVLKTVYVYLSRFVTRFE